MGRHRQRFCARRWPAGRAVALRVVGAGNLRIVRPRARHRLRRCGGGRPRRATEWPCTSISATQTAAGRFVATAPAAPWRGRTKKVWWVSSVTLHAIDGAHEGGECAATEPRHHLNVAGTPAWKDPHMEGASHAAFLDTGSPHHMEWLSQLQGPRGPRFGRGGLSDPPPRGLCPGRLQRQRLGGHDAALHIRTFERGVEAETLSCGTGVVASALADIARGDAPSGVHQRNVQARGGMLEVTATVDGDGAFSKVWLHGAAKRMFKGTYTLALALLALWHAPAWPATSRTS